MKTDENFTDRNSKYSCISFYYLKLMERYLPSERPVYLRYLLAISLVTAATYLKILFINWIGFQTPFLLYFGITIVCSRWLGTGPACLSLFVSLFAIPYFFMKPYNVLMVDKTEAVQLLFFTLESLLLIGLSGSLIKIVKENLSHSQLFEAIMEKSSDGIVVVNKEGKRIYCSPSVQRVLGYTAEEYLHLPAWKLGHPDELEQIKAQYKDLIESGAEGAVLLHRMKHKKGHWIWVESRVSNSLSVRNLQAMIANFNDVTARIEAEQSRKDFIGIVSHELKSPLTSMKSYAQLLVKKLEGFTDGNAAGFASKILQLNNRMAKLINDMLDVATINTGQMKLEITNIDLNALVYEIIDALQQTTNKHIINIELCASADISGDRERISQVVINLVSNAIKYSPSGGEIEVTSELVNNKIRLHVRDQGIGIPEKDIDMIFNRLYRVSSMGSIKGLGFGLFICNQIIQQHGGSIGVNSQEGKGSAFWFELPHNNLVV